MAIELVNPYKQITKELVRDALLAAEGQLYTAAQYINNKSGASITTNHLKDLITKFGLDDLYYDLYCDMERKLEEFLLLKVMSNSKEALPAAIALLKGRYGWGKNVAVNSNNDESAKREKEEKYTTLSDEELELLHKIAKKSTEAA